MTPFPLQRMSAALIDDMERADGRTELGHPAGQQHRYRCGSLGDADAARSRAEGGHALLVTAQMADKGPRMSAWNSADGPRDLRPI